MILISSIKQELKILIFFNISKIEIILKTLFSSRLFIFFFLDFINNIDIKKDKEFFLYKKLEILAIF